MIAKLLYILLVGFFSFSCTNSRRSEAQSIIKEWVGKEIKFPTDYQCHVYLSDTTQAVGRDLLGKPFKILSYVDSTGCTSCRLELPMWQKRMAEADSLFSGQVSFIFFMQPKDIKDLNMIFKLEEFHYPVFVDRQRKLEQLNHLPQDAKYQCFLVDAQNKVVMIGDPCRNLKIWELYKSTIAKHLNGERDGKLSRLHTSGNNNRPYTPRNGGLRHKDK